MNLRRVYSLHKLQARAGRLYSYPPHRRQRMPRLPSRKRKNLREFIRRIKQTVAFFNSCKFLHALRNLKNAFGPMGGCTRSLCGAALHAANVSKNASSRLRIDLIFNVIIYRLSF